MNQRRRVFLRRWFISGLRAGCKQRGRREKRSVLRFFVRPKKARFFAQLRCAIGRRRDRAAFAARTRARTRARAPRAFARGAPPPPLCAAKQRPRAAANLPVDPALSEFGLRGKRTRNPIAICTKDSGQNQKRHFSAAIGLRKCLLFGSSRFFVGWTEQRIKEKHHHKAIALYL